MKENKNKLETYREISRNLLKYYVSRVSMVARLHTQTLNIIFTTRLLENIMAHNECFVYSFFFFSATTFSHFFLLLRYFDLISSAKCMLPACLTEYYIV